MISLEDNSLVFSFPEVHEDAVCTIHFQRTLRVPDDNRTYPLPPGLGRFPLEHVEDHEKRLPEKWSEHGGVLLPMYQAEAMWICFGSPAKYPFAVKISAGKINAVTGDTWSNDLSASPQDYVVIPSQPWLDGFSVRKGLVRQFVAMPLGKGYTAEEQITDSAEFGGLQIIAYPMKKKRFEQLANMKEVCDYHPTMEFCSCPIEMGLAPGGLMRQEIYSDNFGIEAWDTSISSRCFAHILNSTQWRIATNRMPPDLPPTALDYTNAGLPWFEYYAENLVAFDGSTELAGLDSVAAKDVKTGDHSLPENDFVKPKTVTILGTQINRVTDGKW